MTYPAQHNLARGPFPDWACSSIKEMFPSFHGNLFYNKEIVCSTKINHIFDGEKILLVGGGQSTNDINWYSQIDNYDSIWSMNNAAFVEDIGTHCHLICLGANVNIKRWEIAALLKGHCIIGFEPHQKYGPETTKGHAQFEDWKGVKSYVNNELASKYEKNMFAWQTRFWGRIGIGARMLILAAELGVKQVDFVGLDGPLPYITKQHAFEPGKTIEALPTSIKYLTEGQMIDVFQSEYQMLAQILKKYPIKFNNLAKDLPYNIVRDILE